jgi:glycolate oxidase
LDSLEPPSGLGAGGVDLMRRIKQVLDPGNVMNPGKIFAT